MKTRPPSSKPSNKPDGPNNDTSKPDKPNGPIGDNKDTKKNKDGSDVKRDKDGNVDNNANGNKDGSGIDVNSPRPDDKHPDLQYAYDEKKRMQQEGKMAELTAKQALSASLAEIKQWAAEAEKTGADIG